jgi:multicomponent Na+:H+ antiporter subunit E
VEGAVAFLVTWVLLAALWVGLSGYFDAVHLAFGAASVTLVSLISHRYLFPAGGGVAAPLGRLARLVLYSPWLVWQVVLANWDVLLRVAGLRPIDPLVVRIPHDLKSPFGVTTLANSITLTPGTVTLDVEGGDLVVHAISPGAAEGVVASGMVARCQRVEGSG